MPLSLGMPGGLHMELMQPHIPCDCCFCQSHHNALWLASTLTMRMDSPPFIHFDVIFIYEHLFYSGAGPGLNTYGLS